MSETRKNQTKYYYELMNILHEHGGKIESKELRALHKELIKYKWFGVPFMNRYPVVDNQ